MKTTPKHRRITALCNYLIIERLRGELMSTALKLGVLSADEKFLDDVKNTILKRLNDEQLSVGQLN